MSHDLTFNIGMLNKVRSADRNHFAAIWYQEESVLSVRQISKPVVYTVGVADSQLSRNDKHVALDFAHDIGLAALENENVSRNFRSVRNEQSFAIVFDEERFICERLKWPMFETQLAR